MEAMNVTMTPIWPEFKSQLQAQLKQINDLVKQVFDHVLQIASNATKCATVVDRALRSKMEKFFVNLRHRQDLTLDEIDEAIEEFGRALTDFHFDAFNPKQIAIIGTLVEDAYHAANLEGGKFSAHLPTQSPHGPYAPY
jgi:hypothetical protein